MFFATVRFTVAKNPDKCPNLRTVGNYMGNCRKKRTSQWLIAVLVGRLDSWDSLVKGIVT